MSMLILFKTPYLQVERNLVREFNDILGDSLGLLGERWQNDTV